VEQGAQGELRRGRAAAVLSLVPWRRWPWPAIAAGLAGLALAASDAWHGLELRLFDRVVVATAPGESPLPITIIAIDEESMEAVGKQWPWPRGVHAQLLQRLKEAGAALVAFDVLFAEPDPNPREDAAFAAAIRDFGPVVLAASLEYRETALVRQWVRTDPLPKLADAGATVGLASIRTDADGVVRNIPLSQGALWLEVIGRFDRARPGLVRHLSASENDRIRYLGPPQTFTTLPYFRLLDPDKHLSPNWRDALRDNIVLVGRTLKAAPDLKAVESDAFFTPFFAQTGQLMPGVEIHANVIANMVTGEALHEAPREGAMLLVALVALVCGAAMYRWRPLPSGAWALGTAAALAALEAWMFHSKRLWIPPGAALATIALAYGGFGIRGFLGEQARRRELRRAFAQYVSPAIVDEIVANPQLLKLGGDRREITLLFTDLQGFTSLSEELAVEEVARLLNEHLGAMTEVVLKHGGTVDKFVGDAVMAFWGAPTPDAAQSLHAVEAAVEMQARMAALRAQATSRAARELRMRVGLHRGECIVGNFGGTHRFDYTAIGDNVNLAARIEGVNKVYGTGILASGEVAQALGGARRLRPVDSVRVKGRRAAVDLFTPCDDESLVAATETALASYRHGDWQEALRAWQAILEAHPGDPVASVFLGRLREWGEGGWPSPWDGVTTLESK
jgi:adenylate cyclase